MFLLRGQTPLEAFLTGLGDLPEHDTGRYLSDLSGNARRRKKTEEKMKPPTFLQAVAILHPRKYPNPLQGSQCALPSLEPLIQGVWAGLGICLSKTFPAGTVMQWLKLETQEVRQWRLLPTTESH